ncbi:hypothetical protein AX15_000361 [Amanita polypyramis BW_CC]|nr:hypothetical protein AX15_000361 [Amanita polypyramis BW_CC]
MLENQQRTLKVWGEPISHDEILRLSELEEFEHASHVNKSVAIVQKRPRPTLDTTTQPRKKRRLFSGSLHRVIAQPHFYSSTGNTTVLSQTVEVPAYKKTKPINIPPYGNDFILLLRPLSAYARTAWIIPVWGILPWSACTPAVVLDEDEDGVGKEGGWIQWTQAALTEFWAFLLGVRAAGKLGQVGISFHVVTAREREASLSADTVNEQYSNSTHGIGELQVWSLPLSSADHFKVYHEANNAMSLRKVLDAWAYTFPSGQKIRVLKRSRLVLVDERCRGILVS